MRLDLDAIEALDDRLADDENLHVWLVIRDRAQFESAAGYGLCRATRPAITPESLFDEGCAPTFGTCRDKAQRLAGTMTTEGRSWGARFFARIVQDEAATRALENINAQRNNLAAAR